MPAQGPSHLLAAPHQLILWDGDESSGAIPAPCWALVPPLQHRPEPGERAETEHAPQAAPEGCFVSSETALLQVRASRSAGSICPHSQNLRVGQGCQAKCSSVEWRLGLAFSPCPRLSWIQHFPAEAAVLRHSPCAAMPGGQKMGSSPEAGCLSARDELSVKTSHSSHKTR